MTLERDTVNDSRQRYKSVQVMTLTKIVVVDLGRDASNVSM